jgi:maltose alpha-D-glucosyltransferase / alpha-amylase
MLPDDPLWYKDAVIYQLHVKTFLDSTGNGVGDFQGLAQKLDYLQDLGTTAIWLLPFYPSPLRDDGYDISNYRAVNSAYGSMRDFHQFVHEAHRRGMRVITELVINHTSDQHPWFQRARNAKPGSKFRDWYVWSDTNRKYAGTRIIFSDTETSNWAWDPVAKSFFWHRFFSHQPDLNFANPQVVRAVIATMNFWFETGVDGMRLDAIPYLCEREGTSNENIPETHTVLKQLRVALDRKYKNRMFLAEANQWPEDVQEYFGHGDECHMAYHFPLMPRMYMAIAQEDRHPITDIMRQTPDIPESCQWAVFLRNHDELTLEMVTDAERDYLWRTYASDHRARINLGIRRRLAPLMENDRRKIELMNSLLMSMRGTPIIYYGDEIGMGDNIFLGDRNSVRTPMQWTPDRNGGFSRADPAQLYLPPLMDSIYGYQSVNVEAQSRNSSSLLNWMKRLIAVRQSRRVFGRGTLTFLYPQNRKILAYLRELDDEIILCVANLANSAQSVELDLSAYKGRVPTELLGRERFVPIGDAFYQLTLQGHSFFWFQLLHPEATGIGGTTGPAQGQEAMEYVTLIMDDDWSGCTEGRGRTIFERDVLRQYLPTRRWYAAKDKKLENVKLTGAIPLQNRDRKWLLTILDANIAGEAHPERYFLPMAAEWRELHSMPPQIQNVTLARIRKGPREGILYECVEDPEFALAAIDDVRQNKSVGGPAGMLEFRHTSAFSDVTMPETPVVRPLGLEQSNSSVLVEDYLVMKLYRKLASGIHPEIEMGRFLTDTAKFPNIAPLMGTIELKESAGQKTALAALHKFVRNQGDAWLYTLNYLVRFLDEIMVLPADQLAMRKGVHDVYLMQMRQLGERTAQLHKALCPAKAERSFAPEPLSAADIRAYIKDVSADARLVFRALAAHSRMLAGLAKDHAAKLLANRKALMAKIGNNVPAEIDACKTRYHGDYHLGQIVVAQNDFYILDFEGEPRRSLAARRQKHTPVKDVAGMLRSLDYAGWAALERVTADHPERRDSLIPQVRKWRDQAQEAFLAAYRQEIAGTPSYPANEKAASALLELATLEKLFYEIRYELAHRPAWVAIPIASAADMLLGAH